jgi:ATP-dependent Clp protease protease subunit
MKSLIPVILEKTANGERCSDIYSRLLKDRIIFLADEIDSEVAGSVIAQMLYLQLENKEADISIYIMSPGGSVSAGLAIYDTMQHVSNKIATYCIGEAASMAAVLLAAGAKGKRYALPSARIMIHQPWGGASGDAKDIQIQAKEIERMRATVTDRLSKHTGKPLKTIEQDTDRDFFMSAQEAKTYGIIDKVLTNK